MQCGDAQHGHPVPLIPSCLPQVPKGGSVPPATEITKPPVVAQAQERKPQVAYKTEIVGGVVVHTPISINQVSWAALSVLEAEICSLQRACKPFPCRYKGLLGHPQQACSAHSEV